jgi:hypothetical protein
MADIISEFDNVFFTETHLKVPILDNDIKFNGFEAQIRLDRTAQGGGLLFIVKVILTSVEELI